MDVLNELLIQGDTKGSKQNVAKSKWWLCHLVLYSAPFLDCLLWAGIMLDAWGYNGEHRDTALTDLMAIILYWSR